MKTAIVVIIIALAVNVRASCPDGCEPHANLCACELVAFKAVPIDITTDEEPSKHPQAAWERGDVKADMPQNLIAQDFALDEEKRQANAEGMKNAGIEIKGAQ